MNPDMEDHLTRLPPEGNWVKLPAYTVEFLNGLRPEEVEAMRVFSRLSEEEVKTMKTLSGFGSEGTKQILETMKLAQSIMTVGKFMRWVIIGVLAIFFASVMLAEKIMQVVSWIVHGPKI